MRYALVAAAGVALAGCSTLPLQSGGSGIEEWKVVNAVKCEVQDFLNSRKGRPDGRFYTLSPVYAGQAELTLKTSTGKSASAAVGTILPLGSGTIAPSFGVSVSEAKTISSTTVFLFQQKQAGGLADCTRLPEAERMTTFSGWLEKKFDSERFILAGNPKVGLRQIVLATDFGIRQDIQGGVKLSFIPVTVSGGATASQEDVQTLKLTFRGHFAENPPKLPDSGPAARRTMAVPPAAAPALLLQ